MMAIDHSCRVLAKCLCALAIISLLVPPDVNASTIIQGSGVNANLSGFVIQRDAFWNIVALPAVNSIGSPTTPYAAYVPLFVPGVWYGGNTGTNGTQGGYSADGNTYYWIGPTGQNFFPQIASGTYNWIAAQTFSVTTSGLYEFNFYASGDNGIRFFIDGSIDASNPQEPTITGGTQIGGFADNFSVVTQYTGQATLSSGTHTAYMVLTDYSGATGALIGQSVFAAVPEPSTCMIALAGLACGSFSMWRRQKRV